MLKKNRIRQITANDVWKGFTRESRANVTLANTEHRGLCQICWSLLNHDCSTMSSLVYSISCSFQIIFGKSSVALSFSLISCYVLVSSAKERQGRHFLYLTNSHSLEDAYLQLSFFLSDKVWLVWLLNRRRNRKFVRLVFFTPHVSVPAESRSADRFLYSVWRSPTKSFATPWHSCKAFLFLHQICVSNSPNSWCCHVLIIVHCFIVHAFLLFYGSRRDRKQLPGLPMLTSTQLLELCEGTPFSFFLFSPLRATLTNVDRLTATASKGRSFNWQCRSLLQLAM